MSTQVWEQQTNVLLCPRERLALSLLYSCFTCYVIRPLNSMVWPHEWSEHELKNSASTEFELKKNVGSTGKGFLKFFCYKRQLCVTPSERSRVQSLKQSPRTGDSPRDTGNPVFIQMLWIILPPSGESWGLSLCCLQKLMKYVWTYSHSWFLFTSTNASWMKLWSLGPTQMHMKPCTLCLSTEQTLWHHYQDPGELLFPFFTHSNTSWVSAPWPSLARLEMREGMNHSHCSWT